jgi:hypothetical protein
MKTIQITDIKLTENVQISKQNIKRIHGGGIVCGPTVDSVCREHVTFF